MTDEALKKDKTENKKKKKHGAVFWLIMLALSLCAFGICGSVFAALYDFEMYDSTVRFEKRWNERLLRSYAVQALSDYQDDLGLTELSGTNFKYAVFESDDPDSVNLSKRSSYIVCTLSDEDLSENVKDLFRYSATLGDYTHFEYNTDNLINAYGYITNYGSYGAMEQTSDALDITRTVYNWNTDSAYVIGGDYYFPVDMYLETSDGLLDYDFRQYLNETKDGWGWKSDIPDGFLVLQGSYSNSYTDFSNVEVVSTDDLKGYKNGSSYSYIVDFESGNVWVNLDHKDEKPVGRDFYLYAKVADPLNDASDDLFTKSAPLVDIAESLRYLPIVLAVIFAGLSIFFFVKFAALFFKALGKWLKALSMQWHENVALFWRLVGLCILIVGVEFLGVIFALGYDRDFLVIGWVLQTLIFVPIFIICALQLNRIAIGAERLSKGSVNSRIDTSHMFFDFKTIGESVNKMQTGLELAVSERMKSEHFKTELISNVSHDIKTPLTSIISYSELLKNQPEGEAANREYLEALERQSVKLKKLLEDLIEASKATTGNLSVDIKSCNVNMILHQVIGEYEEKLSEKNLDLKIKLPEEDIEILTDPGHLQRVLDNILTNIYKYAQPGTRAYVNLRAGEENATVEFLNTSADPLNISSEELLQRFVRGDESRNSEGNGLGLSIAQSLMELMNGRLKLEIEGDLFKVILLFPKATK